jgi:hypothetical protein
MSAGGRNTAMSGDSIRYHSLRAQAELDLAMRASHIAAARAHFDLSSLHIQQLEALIEPAEIERAAPR